MSYVREDDRSGRLSEFRERLEDEVRIQIGEPFTIFQDRTDIQWGQNWKTRIENSLDGVTFLVPIITPSFFRSPACREELRRFVDREKSLGRDDLILPLYYVDTPLLNESKARRKDPLAQLVATRQYEDWRNWRFEPFSSPEMSKLLARFASQIRDALDRLDGPLAHIPVRSSVSPSEDAEFGSSYILSTTRNRKVGPLRAEYPAQASAGDQGGGEGGSRSPLPVERFGYLFDWVVAKFEQISTSLVVVHGPKAFGKGESLDKLVAHLRASGTNALWDADDPIINGRFFDLAMARLRAVADMRRNGWMNGRWVFMENLDIFFDQVPGEPQLDFRLNEERVRLVAELLVAAYGAMDPADPRGSDVRVVVTMSRDPAAIFDDSHRISSVLIPAAKIALAEHPEAWRLSLKHTLHAWFPKAVATEVEKSVWTESDGHPALLRAAVEGLAAIREAGTLPPVADLCFAARSAMLMQGTAPIRRQLRRLRGSKEELAARAVQVLTAQLAGRPDEPLSALPSTVDLLWEAGLLQPLDRIGQFRLAGGVLREVLRDELGVGPSTRLVLEDDVRHQQLRMEVVTADGTVRRAILAGNSYVIGTILLAPNASIVSLDELRKRLTHSQTGEELRTRGAITALHRFLGEMKKLSPGSDLVENVRGVGYRVITENVEIIRRTAG